MTTSDPFKLFEQALENRLGTPDGLTDTEVELQIKSLYGSVFAAIDKYGRILNYQDKNYNISYKFTGTSRSTRKTTCNVIIKNSNGSMSIPVGFSTDGITGGHELLYKKSPLNNNQWNRSESDHFITSLGEAIVAIIAQQ